MFQLSDNFLLKGLTNLKHNSYRTCFVLIKSIRAWDFPTTNTEFKFLVHSYQYNLLLFSLLNFAEIISRFPILSHYFETAYISVCFQICNILVWIRFCRSAPLITDPDPDPISTLFFRSFYGKKCLISSHLFLLIGTFTSVCKKQDI